MNQQPFPTTTRLIVGACLAVLVTLGSSPAQATCIAHCEAELVDGACATDATWVVEGALRVVAQCFETCSAMRQSRTQTVEVEGGPLASVSRDGVGRLEGHFEPDGTCDGQTRWRWTGPPLCSGVHRLELAHGGYEFVVSNSSTECAPVRRHAPLATHLAAGARGGTPGAVVE